MTEGKNIFSRFFRMLVMLHKIPYAHFTEWNNKRKHKALAAGVYCLSIIPEYVLLAGTFLAARGQDGYVHLVNGRIYKESRYERLKAEFDRMENSEKKRRRTIFWIFTGITLLAGYAAYRLFCRFNMQFLLP